jgi:hypothetical protein
MLMIGKEVLTNVPSFVSVFQIHQLGMQMMLLIEMFWENQQVQDILKFFTHKKGAYEIAIIVKHNRPDSECLLSILE